VSVIPTQRPVRDPVDLALLIHGQYAARAARLGHTHEAVRAGWSAFGRAVQIVAAERMIGEGAALMLVTDRLRELPLV
jgi:hypothetical protein